MPRVAPRLLHQARKIDSLLPLVLQVTRDIASAKNELRWLKEFVTEQPLPHSSSNRCRAQKSLRQLCFERSRGKPLQYLMGTEYFGDLEILCEPGVLIPRQETAASVTHLVERLQRNNTLPEHLKILDLCTGTGCIPLLASYQLKSPSAHKNKLEVLGVDISPTAINLARRNLEKQRREGLLPSESPDTSLHFIQADVLAKNDTNQTLPPLTTVLQKHSSRGKNWDILISNPPYISPSAFKTTTTRSVKLHEPKLALVPLARHASLYPSLDAGDVFYPRLLDIAEETNAQIVLFEVADLGQAGRVAEMVVQRGTWSGVEVWRDDPEAKSTEDTTKEGEKGEEERIVRMGVKIVGSGNGRSVFAYRGRAKDWLGD